MAFTSEQDARIQEALTNSIVQPLTAADRANGQTKGGDGGQCRIGLPVFEARQAALDDPAGCP